MISHIVLAVITLLTLFNCIFIALLVAQPREFKDANNNIDYFKIYGAAFFLTLILLMLYALVVVLSKMGKNKKIT